MTIETTIIKKIYLGNGVATEWPVPFPYAETDDLKLILTDPNGKETEITENFRVVISASGDTSIIYPVSGVAVIPGYKVTVYRATPLTQIVDLITAGNFSPDVLEHDALDRLEMQIQEVRERVDRAITTDMTSEESAEELLRRLEEAQDAADEAARILEQIKNLLDGAYLQSGVYNLRRAWMLADLGMEGTIPSGTVITMPVQYYPTRNILELRYDGGACIPSGVGVGGYQYEEMGSMLADGSGLDPNIPSAQIRILFDADAEKIFDAWIVTSALGRNLDEMNRLISIAKESAGIAERSAYDAENSADLAAQSETSAASSAATASQVKVSGYTYDIGSRTLTISIADGSEYSLILPQADTGADGLMTSADVSTILDLVSRVESLEAGGLWRGSFDTYAALVAAYPGLDVSSTTWLANDFIFVLADENHDPATTPETSYIVTQDGATKKLAFRKVERSGIPIFTNTSAGMIQGATTSGKVFAETDGTGSVVGWDTVVHNARQINTTGPLAGGGDLSGNRTLSISPATAATAISNGAAGSVIYASDSNTTARDMAATPAGVAAQIDGIGGGKTGIGQLFMRLDVPVWPDSGGSMSYTAIDDCFIYARGTVPVFDGRTIAFFLSIDGVGNVDFSVSNDSSSISTYLSAGQTATLRGRNTGTRGSPDGFYIYSLI